MSKKHLIVALMIVMMGLEALGAQQQIKKVWQAGYQASKNHDIGIGIALQQKKNDELLQAIQDYTQQNYICSHNPKNSNACAQREQAWATLWKLKSEGIALSSANEEKLALWLEFETGLARESYYNYLPYSRWERIKLAIFNYFYSWV